jgi:hypothetical protein
MRIAIHDGDAHGFPNLALMKISAYYKARGDEVEWFNALMPYDRVYSSKVFTFTPVDEYLPPDAIRGGQGTESTRTFPKRWMRCSRITASILPSDTRSVF